MRVNGLRLQNYRGIVELNITFDSDKNLHVIYGENGKGKTSIITAIVTALSTIPQKVLGKFRQITERDFTMEQLPSKYTTRIENCNISLTATGLFWEEEVNDWIVFTENIEVFRKNLSEKCVINSDNIQNYFLKTYDKVREFNENTLPVFVYAESCYLSSDYYSRIHNNLDGESAQGYLHSFESGNMEDFVFGWLSRMYEISLDTSKNALILYEGLPQAFLDMFKQVVTSMFPEIIDITWVHQKELRDKISKKEFDYFTCFDFGSHVVDFKNLSGSYTYFVTLIGEIAIRALLLNKHLMEFAPSLVDGVVLIDDFGNHLSPLKHRTMLFKLTQLFPSIQFIVSTRSYVLVRPEDENVKQVIVL